MTEQEKYGMDQLLKYLEMQINLKSDRIRMYKKQMDSNYLYYFAWGGQGPVQGVLHDREV